MLTKNLLVISIVILSQNTFAKNDLGLTRKENQERRINSGVATGALTPQEAEKMRTEQAAIKAMRQAYKATGGGLSDSEKAQLKGLRDEASKHIYNQKHDKATVNGSVAESRDEIARRLSRGEKKGQLTAEEAAAIRQDMGEFHFLKQGLAQDAEGITEEDAKVLAEREKAIQKKIHEARHNNVGVSK